MEKKPVGLVRHIQFQAAQDLVQVISIKVSDKNLVHLCAVSSPYLLRKQATGNQMRNSNSKIRFQAQTSHNSKAVCSMRFSTFKFIRDQYFEIRFMQESQILRRAKKEMNSQIPQKDQSFIARKTPRLVTPVCTHDAGRYKVSFLGSRLYYLNKRTSLMINYLARCQLPNFSYIFSTMIYEAKELVNDPNPLF